MKTNDFKVKFWGVRGSHPVVNKNFLKYGGNTACVEIVAGKHTIIIDCGTGMIPLGDKMFKEHISSASMSRWTSPCWMRVKAACRRFGTMSANGIALTRLPQRTAFRRSRRP